jgi:hypothetical protein
MEHTVAVYSKVFLESYDPNDWSNVTVDRSLWEEIHRIQTPLFYGAGGRLPDAASHRYFMRFNDDCIVAIGNPAMVATGEKKVYMPHWLLDQSGLQGEGESVKIEILTEEAFPQATKIILRVVDSAFYNSDVKKELEVALTRLGIIKKNQLLHIPIEALDNFTVDIYVSELEPANIVLCEGEEVVVEFEEPVDAFESKEKEEKEEEKEKETSPFAVETAMGLRPPTPIPSEFESLLPPPPVLTGNVLGSDPSAVPEWRRGLAAPPQRRQQR